MKKLFVSAGLIAAGAASLQSVSGQSSDSVISPKAWSVSGTLRGFYDDNYNISANRKGSAGFEFSPSVSYNASLQQTDMGIRYTYGLYYYQDRQDLDLNPIDQSHQLDIWLDHAINEKWHLNFNDTFAVGQEPELLSGSGVSAIPYRVEGNNIANHAKVSVDTQWTHLFGTSVYYQNDFYQYENSGAQFSRDIFGDIDGVSPSLAGILNRDEQDVGFNLNWTLSPTTKILAGYTFGIVNYLAGEPIAINPTATGFDHSDNRDYMSHNVYVGLNYQLTGNLSFQGTVGAEYIDSYNDSEDQNNWTPTANISLTYTYLPGSYLQVGVTQDQNSTDVVQPDNNGSLTQYQVSTSVYADVNQKITSKLTGTLIARYIYSSFEGGAFSSDQDNDYSLGANLSYQISRHFSCEAGYNYDNLHSDVPGRGFTRNRVYLGVGANY